MADTSAVPRAQTWVWAVAIPGDCGIESRRDSAGPGRDAVVLTELEALTQQELANRLGISLSGAKSRVQRGRAQLKQMLDEGCTFEFDRRGKVIGCEPREKAGCKECR
jgi:hypothetical protein